MLVKLLDKYRDEIVDPKGYAKLKLLSAVLDNKKDYLNSEDFWTMSSDITKLMKLYNHYLGFVPRPLSTFTD